MAHPTPIRCDRCRLPKPPDRVLPYSGQVLCDPCFHDALRGLKAAEQVLSSREPTSRQAAA